MPQREDAEMRDRAEAERLAQELERHELYPTDFTAVKRIAAALGAAEQRGAQRALREAAEDVCFADLAKMLVPPDWQPGYAKAQRESDIEAETRILVCTWLRARADALPVSSGDEVKRLKMSI